MTSWKSVKVVRTGGHTCSISHKFSNNYKFNFFIVYSIAHWNSLPQDMFDPPSLSFFKIRGKTVCFAKMSFDNFVVSHVSDFSLSYWLNLFDVVILV